MNKQLSNELRDYLSKCGLSAKKIECCTYETRMYHDFGIYGDITKTCMSVLEDYYHVDLSGFKFEEFFSARVYWQRYVYSVIPSGFSFYGKYDPETSPIFTAHLEHD